MDHINSDTSISIVLAGVIISTLLGAYHAIQPFWQQIEINQTRIDSHQNTIESLSTQQQEYNRHILTISKSLSRIEGKLEALDRSR